MEFAANGLADFTLEQLADALESETGHEFR
jgi:hypothetical protein